MTAYYNDNDPRAAAWLRELQRENLIAPGDVDERDIRDVSPSELAGYLQCHFFAGIGGWSYALRLAGWPDDRPVWTGSCPCQSFSAAGGGRGIADERHLWPAWFYFVTECRPVVLFGEQVSSVDGLQWFDIVQGDLESETYRVCGADLCASSIGAPHIRQRIFFVADICGLGNAGRTGFPSCEQKDICVPGRRNERRTTEQSSRASRATRNTAFDGGWNDAEWLRCRDDTWRPVEPGSFPLADGIPGRVGLLRGYGNAIVPALAASFVSSYMSVA